MKSLASLVKKDFLLIRKYILAILFISIGTTIFTSINTPEFKNQSSIFYMMLASLVTYITYHMITMEEVKAKGMVYMHTTPISHDIIGFAKFIIVTVSFLTITGIYIILSMIKATNIGAIEIKDILLTYTLINLFFSIYIPLTYKLGYTKLQLVNAGIIMISPFLIRIISDRLTDNLQIFFKFENISMPVFLVINISIVIAILCISIIATSFFLGRKEYYE